MIVVILHSHYERGGVTQVVENHVRALRDSGQFERIVLATGGRHSGLSTETLQEVELINLDGFDYDTISGVDHTLDGVNHKTEEWSVADGLHVADLATRQQRMLLEFKRKLLDHGLGVDGTLLHWHNHSLGKNTAVPGVIQTLASEGWRILLQVHDFAEDYRPENYRGLVFATRATSKQEVDQYLYPQHDRIHYATLTRADSCVLEHLGVHRDRLHYLPNSVTAPQGDSFSQEEARTNVLNVMKLPCDARWSLYPVRGIRRKNIGELLLLARWGDRNRYMGLTLKPSTALERRSYDRWKCVAADVSNRTVFDAGESPDLTLMQNISAADYVVSTSVAEGFGMAFLEPWLLGRGVIARRLSTVADDFEHSGVDLRSFYDSIPIPGNNSWLNECRREIRDSRMKAWSLLPEAFRPSIELSDDETEETIDFAKLTPQRQVKVLRRMVADQGFENAARELSGTLIASLNQEFAVSVLMSNADAVIEKYGTAEIGESLVRIYHQLNGVLSGCQKIGSRRIEDELRDVACDQNFERQSGIDLISAFRPYFPCRTEVL